MHDIWYDESDRCYKVVNAFSGEAVWAPGMDVTIGVFDHIDGHVEDWEVGYSTRERAVAGRDWLEERDVFNVMFVGPASPFDLPF